MHGGGGYIGRDDVFGLVSCPTVDSGGSADPGGRLEATSGATSQARSSEKAGLIAMAPIAAAAVAASRP